MSQKLQNSKHTNKPVKDRWQSLFYLKKTTEMDKIDPTHTTEMDKTDPPTHTVNFFTDEIVDDNITSYFNSRLRFLKEAYNFAKEVKLAEDFDFADDTNTKAKLKDWLTQNQMAEMVDGTEFGVITTKLINSVDSIKKNQYLEGLADKLIQVVYLKKHPEAVNTESKKTTKLTIPKDFGIQKTDILELTSTQIREIFNYSLVDKSSNFIKLTEVLTALGVLETECDELLPKLNDFNSQAERLWQEVFEELNEQLKQNNNLNDRQNLAKFYVLKLYFQFDGKIRKLEDQLTPDINSILNKIRQELPDQLLEKWELSQGRPEYESKRKELLKVWFGLDWTENGVVDKLKKRILKIEKQLEDKGEQTPFKKGKRGSQDDEDGRTESKVDKDKTALALNHPKNAPSFPSIKDRQVGWLETDRFSELVEAKNQEFNLTKFYDFLLIRLKKITEDSQVYKIWQHLNDSGDFEWQNWLHSYLGDDRAIDFDKPDLESLQKQNLLKTKEHSYSKISAKKVIEVSFTYSDGKINNRLDKVILTNPDLNQWMQRQYLDLAKIHPEVALVRELKKQDLWDSDFMQSWLEILASEEGKKAKLAVKTEARQKWLQDGNLKPSTDNEQTAKVLSTKLAKLEKHLFLDTDWDSYHLFDRLSFSQYKKLAQIALESCLTQAKDISASKGNLAKLSKQRQEVLPIKIGKMTKRAEGNSTLVFPIDWQNRDYQDYQILRGDKKDKNKDDKLSAKILIYPVNMKLVGGAEVKIVASLKKAREELNKPNSKYKYLYAGFLNGDCDNSSVKVTKIMTKTDGTQGQYTLLTDWTVRNDEYGVKVTDERRGNLETLKGTNPPGYPKLYFFLVPNVCNNLMVAVKTSQYYLTKYTPYHHLNRYFELEKDLAKLEADKADEQIIKQKVEKILELRIQLRYFYRLSSIELDLVRDYKLVIVDGKAEIKPKISAKIHFQFTNPKKKYVTQQTQPEYIIGVDLGEKHLACLTLSKVNWDRVNNSDFGLQKNGQPNPFLDTKLQTYLPLQKNEWQQVINDLNDQETIEINPDKDGFYNRYMSKVNAYKSQQRLMGVVNLKLSSSKKNLTDKLAEQVAVQIAKLANKYGALVVFENLSTGFGRPVETVRLYTQIRRLTAQKLGSLGMLDTSFVKSDADLDKFAAYENNRGLYSLVNPSFTSKTCSNCGFVPVYSKEKDGQKTLGIQTDLSDWQPTTGGIIKFTWKNQTIFEIQATSSSFDTWQIKNRNGEVDKEQFGAKICFGSNRTKMFLRDKLAKFLFSDSTGEALDMNKKTNKDDFLKFMLKEVLNPRQSQDQFVCPCCGFSANADYQASSNIAITWLVGNNIYNSRYQKAKNEHEAKIMKGDIRPDKKGIVEKIRAKLNG